jgi:hypothetical protein
MASLLNNRNTGTEILKIKVFFGRHEGHAVQIKKKGIIMFTIALRLREATVTP